jgi:GNAT superfamily N-acetyltransferase
MSDDGSRVEITRFGIRDDRPQNTGSWLIARAREWARLEGFTEVQTYAGIAGNFGTTYEAAGFDCVQQQQADGTGWTTREDRDSWGDYQRRKWVYEFDCPLRTGSEVLE